MKAYPKYKPSNIEWMGEIPEHWNLKKLKSICYLKGRIGWQGLKQSEFTTAGHLPYLITGMNFKDGVIRWEEVYHISEERYNEAPEIQLKVNDVLMTKDGTIGKLLYVDFLPDKTSLNSHLLVLRPLNQSFLPKYLYYLLQSEVFKVHIELNKTGTTFFGMTQEAVGVFKMLLPSINEQTIIVLYLDDRTQKIDRLIEKKQKLIDQLREERTVTINQAVTKGLNPDVPMKDSGIDWMGEVPKHWEVRRLKYVATLKSGDFINAENINPVGNFPVLGGNGLRGYTNTFTHEGNYILIGRQGALCGNINLVAGKFYATEHAVVVTILDKSETIWLAELLRAMNLNQYSQASAQPGLAIETIKNLFVPFPPYKEQKEIISLINSEKERIESTISKIENEVSLLQEYRTALISEVVTGKIDVGEAI